MISKKLSEKLANLNIEILNAKEIKKDIHDEMDHVCNIYTPMYKMRIFKKDNKYYIFFKNPMFEMILKDNNPNMLNTKYILMTLVIITLVLFLSYISIIKKLYPLKILQQKIQNLGRGKLDDVDIKIDGKDEIANLAKEFDKSIDNLRTLRQSRDIFLRNIMHELKTPITKGRFLTKLPSTEENRKKMEKLFLRLETLINEFATIEELISRQGKVQKSEYFVIDIIDNALDILFEDEENITVIEKDKNVKLLVNFKLFSIAVKNLIDNALKYSNDKKASVIIEKDKISFINNSKKLQYPLEKYFEPFFKTGDANKQSFGLGLYIVHSILSNHNMSLSYEYKDSQSIFVIHTA
jgi:two-component system OmpR family sensor kinase